MLNSKLSNPGDVLNRLARLFNSFTLKGLTPVLQSSAQREGSWQLDTLKEVHQGFQLDKPDRYILDCIYYFSLAAKRCGSTSLEPVAEPDWEEVMEIAIELYHRQFRDTKDMETWLDHDGGDQVRGFCPDLENLIPAGVYNDETDRPLLLLALEDQMRYVGEALCIALDCYLCNIYEPKTVRE